MSWAGISPILRSISISKKLSEPLGWMKDVSTIYVTAMQLRPSRVDDIKTVQSNLGHATARFTLDVYGHVSQKMRQQSAERMEQFIRKVSG